MPCPRVSAHKHTNAVNNDSNSDVKDQRGVILNIDSCRVQVQAKEMNNVTMKDPTEMLPALSMIYSTQEAWGFLEVCLSDCFGDTDVEVLVSVQCARLLQTVL